MKTDKITVFTLFETQRRYLVPIFQRGYVCTKEQQWERRGLRVGPQYAKYL